MDTEGIGPAPDAPPGRDDDFLCPKCGDPAAPEWDFCGTCGEPLLAASTDIADRTDSEAYRYSVVSQSTPELDWTPPPIDQHAGGTRVVRQPGRRIASLVLVGLVLVGLAGAAGYLQYETHRDLEATRQALAERGTELQQTRGQLVEAREETEAVQARLTSTSNELVHTQQDLKASRQRLSGLRGSLDNAESRLDLQANQIETLKSCLNGVTEAMGYAAYSDYGAALAALRAVEISCNRAYDMF